MVNESIEEHTRISFTLKTGNSIMFRIKSIGGYPEDLSYVDDNNQERYLPEISSIFETIAALKDKLKVPTLTVTIYCQCDKEIKQYITPVWRKSRFNNPNLPQKVRLKNVICARTNRNKTAIFRVEANSDQGRIFYLLSEDELDFTNNELGDFRDYKNRVNDYYEQCIKILHD